jgi:hypothetical protein
LQQHNSRRTVSQQCTDAACCGYWPVCRMCSLQSYSLTTTFAV